MLIRSIVAAVLLGTAAPAALADDGTDVKFSAKELQNVYLICAVHGAGTYMMPCVNAQIDKLKAGKEAQLNNKRMEAVTRQQMMGHQDPADAGGDR